ncbi:hypothetical protein C0995_002674 [Termitomyces sp. Mi166|nr:hypothetical protein C0995_002674 [Termitomyces sp. Mi166\
MGPASTPKKTSAGGKPPSGPEVPLESAPPPAESVGHATSSAFGQIRDAIPASSIESAVNHIPGGGIATSAFKVAKGFGGLGIALGSAGAAAISKRRRKSKAGAGNPDAAVESPVNETGPNIGLADNVQGSKIQVNGVSTSPESPSILKPSLAPTQNEHISGYQAYYARKMERGVTPDTVKGYVIPGAYSTNDLPPIVQYTGVQPYIDENGIEHDDLDFTHNIKEIYPRTNGHMQPSDNYAPTSDIINTTHQLEPVIHERVHRVEIEEVTRQIIHDRHIHHVQHHTQPVTVREVLEEKHHEKKIHPSTTVLERHVNNADDLKALDAQVKQHGNTKEYLEPEHFIIDKGSIIKENIHHHIHHIIQPVFEKETMDNHRTHTGIPIEETIHDLTHNSQSIGGNGEDVPEGKWENVIPDAKLVRLAFENVIKLYSGVSQQPK